MAIPEAALRAATAKIRGTRQQQAQQPEDESSLLGTVGRGALSGLAAVGNFLDLPGSAARDVLTGQNPFDQFLSPLSSENRATGRDVLHHYGLATKNDPDKWEVADFTGFGAEVLLDPLSYLGGVGLLKSVGKGGNVLRKAGVKIPSGRVARMTTKVSEAARGAAPEALEAAAKGSGFDSSEAFLKGLGDESVGGLLSYNRPFGSPRGLIGTGPLAQKIGRGLDIVGGAVKESAPVRGLRAAFDRRVMGRVGKFEQQFAEKVSDYRDTGEPMARRATIADARSVNRLAQEFSEQYGDQILNPATDDLDPMLIDEMIERTLGPAREGWQANAAEREFRQRYLNLIPKALAGADPRTIHPRFDEIADEFRNATGRTNLTNDDVVDILKKSDPYPTSRSPDVLRRAREEAGAEQLASGAPPWNKGDVVIAGDRGNHGYVTRVGPRSSEVYFRNPDTGNIKVRTFKNDELTRAFEKGTPESESFARGVTYSVFQDILRHVAETGDVEDAFRWYAPGVDATQFRAAQAVSPVAKAAAPKAAIDVPAVMNKLEPGALRGALVGMRELRKELGLPKQEFDDLMLQLQKEGKVSLHKHDYVAPKTTAEVDEMVFRPNPDAGGTGSHPTGDYYVAGAIRQNTDAGKAEVARLSKAAEAPAQAAQTPPAQTAPSQAADFADKLKRAAADLSASRKIMHESIEELGGKAGWITKEQGSLVEHAPRYFVGASRAADKADFGRLGPGQYFEMDVRTRELTPSKLGVETGAAQMAETHGRKMDFGKLAPHQFDSMKARSPEIRELPAAVVKHLTTNRSLRQRGTGLTDEGENLIRAINEGAELTLDNETRQILRDNGFADDMIAGKSPEDIVRVLRQKQGHSVAEKILLEYERYLDPEYITKNTQQDMADFLPDFVDIPAMDQKRAHARALAEWINGHPQLETRSMLEDHADYMRHSSIVADTLRGTHDQLVQSAREFTGEGGIAVPEVYRMAGMDVNKSLAKFAEKAGVNIQQAKTMQVDPRVATAVAGPVQLFDKKLRDTFLGPFLDHFDRWTRTFKTAVTVPWPGYLGRNFSSGQMVNAISGYMEGPADFARYGKSMQQAKQLLDKARSGEVTPDEQALLDSIESMVYNNRQGFQGVEHEAVSATDWLPGKVSDFRQRRMAAREAVAAEPGLLEGGRLAKPSMAARRGYRAVTGFGTAINQNVEWFNRVPMFLFLKSKGHADDAAARIVESLHFDYGRASPVEREVMRRVFPFYTFSRRAAGMVTNQLLDKPGGALAQIIRATNQGRGDQPLPEYVASTTAIPLGTLPSGSQRYITGLGLAHEDPLSFGGGDLSDFLAEGVSRMNPLLKAPIELAAGESFFQRGPMGGRELADMDPTIGRTLTNIGLREELPGGKARPFGSTTVENLLGNTPAARFLTTARTLTDKRKYEGALPGAGAAVNLLTGVKFSDISPAASDAVLRDQADAAMRELGAQSYNITRFSKAQIEAASPEQREIMQRFNRIKDILQRRSRERKKATKKPAQ